MSDAADATLTFERHRRDLERFAYRMTGTLADAQDIVQDAYMKWQQAAPGSIENPRAWLMTVCSNLALNRWQSARHRREQYVGVWLPEPWIEDRSADPAQQVETDDTISVAFMLALERLSAPERAAFLLREAFDYRFAEIAAILGRSEAACRQLATRARVRLRESRPRFHASASEHPVSWRPPFRPQKVKTWLPYRRC